MFFCSESVLKRQEETEDRKSSPLSSRRQPPTFTKYLSGLIEAITQANTPHNNTHSGPDPPENTFLLRIIQLYCPPLQCEQPNEPDGIWQIEDLSRLRCDRQPGRRVPGGNPAEGNAVQSGRAPWYSRATPRLQETDRMFPVSSLLGWDKVRCVTMFYYRFWHDVLQQMNNTIIICQLKQFYFISICELWFPGDVHGVFKMNHSDDSLTLLWGMFTVFHTE